jgi:hypothetical protein
MRPLGRGTDHVAYLTDGDLVVRCVEGGDPAGVLREARLLAAVAEISPLAVPKPVRVDPREGCMAYERLPGVPLLEVAPAARAAHASSVAGAVGGLLRRLNAVPLARASELVDVDDSRPSIGPRSRPSSRQHHRGRQRRSLLRTTTSASSMSSSMRTRCR